jgi:hypothetical protein
MHGRETPEKSSISARWSDFIQAACSCSALTLRVAAKSLKLLDKSGVFLSLHRSAKCSSSEAVAPNKCSSSAAVAPNKCSSSEAVAPNKCSSSALTGHAIDNQTRHLIWAFDAPHHMMHRNIKLNSYAKTLHSSQFWLVFTPRHRGPENVT